MAVGIGFGWECRGGVGRVVKQGIGERGWHGVGKKPLRREESQSHENRLCHGKQGGKPVEKVRVNGRHPKKL